MDAGIINGLSTLVAQAQPKQNNRTTANGTAATIQTPLKDTVEITTTPPVTGTTASAPAVFDPTATGGPYEQKHIGGALATSSAKDGFNGWEAMLKRVFGIENGGDKSDMPVVRFRPYDKSPDGFGVAAGYVPGNSLTNEQRNFIANVYVYAHDNNLYPNIADVIAGRVVAMANGENYSYFDIDTDAIGDDFGIIPGEFLRDGSRPPRYQNNAIQSQIDAIAVETMTSSATRDSRITQAMREDLFSASPGSGANNVQFYKDAQKLVYAYSPSYRGEDASGSPKPANAEAQRYLYWRSSMMDYMGRLETAASQAGGVQNLIGKPGAGSNVNSGDLFAKYGESRLGSLADSLSKTQKETIGMLYGLAADKGEDAMKKVDALARAFVTNSFFEVMLLPGKDKDGKDTTNLLDMLVWTKDVPNQARFLQAAFDKKNDAALTKVQERLQAKPAAQPEPAVAHIDTEA